MEYLEAKLTIIKKQRKIISLPIETLKILKKSAIDADTTAKPFIEFLLIEISKDENLLKKFIEMLVANRIV